MPGIGTLRHCTNTALRLARGGLIASLCILGSPTVGNAAIDLSDKNPAIQALLHTPTMEKAMAEGKAGNMREAAVLFQQAARQGNQLGNIFLALAYFDGQGVKKDRGKAVALIYKVIQKSESPSVFIAYKVISQMSEVMKASPDPKDRAMGGVAVLGALGASPYAQQWSENMRHVRVIPCYLC